MQQKLVPTKDGDALKPGR